MSTILDELERTASCRNLTEAMVFQGLVGRYGPELVRVARAAAHLAWESEDGNGPTDGSLVVALEALEPLLQASEQNQESKPAVTNDRAADS